MPPGETLRVNSTEPERAGRRASATALVRRQLTDPLARNANALVGSTLASAGFGLVFWVAAARLYSTADVGVDTALISAMGLLATFAMLNLTNAFNRFVPTAGTGTRRLVGVGYLVTITLAALAAIGFVAGVQAGWWTPELSVVVGQHAQGVWFVVATMIWTLFTLQDAVLTGLGEAPWVFVENVSYGVLKLVLLLAVADRLPRTGVFVAWTAPLIVFVAGINLLLFGRLIPQRRHPPAERIDARVIGRFISADYPASLMLATVVGLMPLLAITITGSAKSSAYVYLAWTFAYTLHLVSTNVGGSMITEASRAPERLVEYARRTVVHALRIVVPLAVILVIAAPYVLRIEGRDYAIHATRLLQLFAIAAIPNVFVATYLNIMRVERRMSAVLVVTAIQSVAVLVPSIVMLHLYGVVGVGIAWLGAETVLALALLVGELRTLWLPYLPAQSIRALVDRASVSQLRLDTRSARRAVLQTFEDSNLNAHGWVPREFVGHTHEVGVLRVALPSWREEGLLKVAMSPLGLESLHRELSALKTVRDSSPPEIDDVLPRVLKFDPKPERGWLLETWFDGIDARSAIEVPGAVDALLADITRRMTSLYRIRSATLRVDEDAFARLVDLPLASTGNTRATHMGAIADSRNLAKVRDELHGELTGRDLVMSLVHGDLWLGNVLWDPATVEVRGIIDWHCATVAFPVIDIVHLICTTRSLTQHRELGSIVQEILAGGALRHEEHALLDSVPGAHEMTLRTAVLLAWMRHVFDGATLSKRRIRRDLWLTHNVYEVLENLSAPYDPAVETAR
jgi:O-antigen/teichoic acid export membrane protein